MSSTGPNKSTKEITAVHVVCIQPLDHHEMLTLPITPDPGIVFEDPNIAEFIHFDDSHPHREFYRRTHIVEMIDLPFSPDSKESGCPLHKHVHPESKPTQEGPEKATSPSSSEPKSEEKLETENGSGSDENTASHGDANNLSPSQDPDDVVGMMYTYTVQYQWSPMLKYCTMGEMCYKPIQLL